MSYSFDSTQYIPAFAAEFLRQNPTRGRVLPLNHLGLTFYVIANGLYFGEASQILLPEQGSALRIVFKESCHYLAGEYTLAPMLERCLAANTEIVDVDEAAALYSPGMDNLWHWMAEGLPKLLALESIGYTGRYLVADSAVVRQSLELFNIDVSRVLPCRGSFRVKRLMVPQCLSGFDLVDYLPLVEFTRNRLLEATGRLEGRKRVYVRRIGRRKPVNEDEVLAVLRDFDFDIMVPEDLSLAEQWRYMSNVECSVMAHGANSALTLLQPLRSSMVELFSNRYVSYNNLHAVRLLRMRYHALIEDLDVSSAPAEEMSLSDFLWSGFATDMYVDIRYLRITLESLLT